MRIAIVGCGTAGPAAALLLARDGHDVTIVERVAEPRGVGAGILLQPPGQEVLRRLGLADDLAAVSAPVRRIEGRTPGGRAVLDFGYGDVDPTVTGWGVHRAALFDLLWSAVGRNGIPVRTGVEVQRLGAHADGWHVHARGGGELGPFSLVVGADGARSRLRRLSGLCRKDVGYPYGALWSIVPDPDRLAGDVLTQRYRDTRITLGVLPTGVGQASIFWALPTRALDDAVAAGPAALVAAARPFAHGFLPLVEGMADADVVAARYRDVVVPRPVLMRGDAGLALIGDAAHAMSPQLGLGASLGLADAWSLAAALRSHPTDLAQALDAHARDRRAHVRWYTWLSRLMTPMFQSDLVPMAWLRDPLLGPVSRIPWVRDQFVTTLMGSRTSPFTEWRLP